MANGLKMEEAKTWSWTETGTTIFAFLNVIVVSMLCPPTLTVLVAYIIESISHTDVVDAFMWSMCVGTNLAVLLLLVCAVLLFLGMYQKKPGFVLAYIIFGTIIDVTLVSAVVASHYVSINVNLKECLRQAFGGIYEIVTHAIIGICVVHILLLSMISRAWFLMRSRRSEGHQKFVNEK